MSKKKKAFFPKRAAESANAATGTDTTQGSGPSAPKPSNVPAVTRSDVSPANQRSGWVRCYLTAELLSDAHIGAGMGAGVIDALVARDRLNRPVIWASHVEGLLRDAARRLRGDQDADALFGCPGGQQQRAVFTSLYATTSPDSHVWRSTACESFDNRAPKDGTLRVIEYVPRGTKLVGEVELPASQLPALRRLVQEVDALGGGRASGAGRVELSIAERTVASRALGSPTGRLLLLLKNRDPLCIAATATPENVIPSLAFVPGRTLLGAMGAWIIAEGDRDTAALLMSGRISINDALPLPSTLSELPAKLDGLDLLPAPLSLHGEKSKSAVGDLPWWAQPTAPTRRVDAWRDTSSEETEPPEDDLFVFRTGANSPWTGFRPPRRVRLRNGRYHPKQVNVSLFAVEQIVEDTYFLAELRGSVEDLRKVANRLAPVLEGRRWLRVGRSGAPVEVVRIVWANVATGAPGKAPAPAPAKALLTLTSDMLVRDDHLRWRTALDDVSLRACVGSEDISMVKSEHGSCRAAQDSVMVYGFNGTSRLWRMPVAAIRRGSVFEITGAGIAKLVERVAKGQWLGERTHEGFGRFRIDAVLPGVMGEARATTAVTPVADADEDAIAATTREWYAAHKSLSRPGRGNDRKPSLSQWADLVADLERNDPMAISGRLESTKLGARGWKHKDARSIMDRLAMVQQPQRKLYARLFVRWLRVDLRKGAR